MALSPTTTQQTDAKLFVALKTQHRPSCRRTTQPWPKGTKALPFAGNTDCGKGVEAEMPCGKRLTVHKNEVRVGTAEDLGIKTE